MVNGCGVVWMWCVCEVRGVGGVMSGKCVVSAVCVRCTACKVRVAYKWRGGAGGVCGLREVCAVCKM